MCDQPELHDGEPSVVLNVLKKYIEFKLNNSEEIEERISNVIFDFIYRNFSKHNKGYMNQFYGDFITDIEFKEILNPIVDIFKLE